MRSHSSFHRAADPARGRSRRAPPGGWRGLWVLLAASLLAALALAGCQRRLSPPPASPKSGSYRPAPLGSAALVPREAPRRSALAPPEPAAEKAPVRVLPTAASLRVAPEPPRALPGRPYDPARPCFTVAQMERARAVLFNEEPGAWGDRWMRAINGAFHDLPVPCGEEDFFVLVLTTIQLESGVTVDPGLENADLEALFTFQLAELRRRNPIAGRLLDYSGLDDAMREKLRADTRKGHVRTEGDLVTYVEADLRTWLADYLREHYFLPEQVAVYAAEQGLPNPVNTIGPMQVNLQKAYLNAKRRGEPVASEPQMRARLLAHETAMERGIKEGVYQLWSVYRYYRAQLAAAQAVQLAAADYNAGEFSSRNAAFQWRVGILTKRRLVLDGDLLIYQSDRPAERVSNTEAAVITLLTDYAAPDIRRDLLLEKTAAFSSSRTARLVCDRYRVATGETCAVGVVPSGATNAVARVKLGRDYTPANYARAYLSRWEHNVARYQGG